MTRSALRISIVASIITTIVLVVTTIMSDAMHPASIPTPTSTSTPTPYLVVNVISIDSVPMAEGRLTCITQQPTPLPSPAYTYATELACTSH